MNYMEKLETLFWVPLI